MPCIGRIYSPFGSFWNSLDGLQYGADRIVLDSARSDRGCHSLRIHFEVAMNATCPMRLAKVPGRRPTLSTPRNMLATWRWRRRFRWELEDRLRADPHLIDDIGLTRQQVEAEIAKPFWRA
jgi:uncharacterized protein YjiS (DUF1127 family)